MTAMWLLASCLFDRARARARAVLDGDRESGALSLEWVVIAVALVAAAGIAAGLISAAIKSAGSTLP
jgi:hypothetical protein